MLDAVRAWLSNNPGFATAINVFLILIATYIAVKLFDGMLKRYFKRISNEMELEMTSYVLLRRLVRSSIYVIGVCSAIYVVPSLRQISVALFASAGFAGIIIGFAAKEAFANLISGIFIAIFQPFHVGDKLEVDGYYGTVEDITLRQTVIQTPSNERVILPNTTMVNSNLLNYSIKDEKSRYSVSFMISYRDDIDVAREIMLEEAEDHELTDKGESEVIVKDLAESGVSLELRIWASDRAEAWRAGQDLRETIKKRFDEEGVTIPFPQRKISYLDEKEDKV